MDKKLTKKQRTMLEMLLLFPFKSDREVAQLAEVSAEQLCHVKKLPQFKEEYERRLNEMQEGARNIAQTTMINLSKDGDRQASAYILDSLGLGAPQKIEASVENKVINVTVKDD